MKRFKKKKAISLVVVVVALAVAAVGAYAYFTSTGSGSGPALAGSNNNSSTVHLTATGFAGIVPGDGGQTVTFNAWNTSPTNGIINTITLAGLTDVTTPVGACATYLAGPGSGDFTLGPLTPAHSPNIVNGNTATPGSSVGTAHLTWANNDNQDQTPCAGETLRLNVNYSS